MFNHPELPQHLPGPLDEHVVIDGPGHGPLELPSGWLWIIILGFLREHLEELLDLPPVSDVPEAEGLVGQMANKSEILRLLVRQPEIVSRPSSSFPWSSTRDLVRYLYA